MNTLLAPDFSVVDTFSDPNLLTDTSTLLKLDKDVFLCAVPLIVMPIAQDGTHTDFKDHYERCETELRGRTLRFYRSDDSGNTWKKLEAALPFLCGHLFAHEKALYYIGVGPARTDILISRSTDKGDTWTDPVQLVNGRFYVAGGAMAILNDRLYWTVNAANEAGEFNSTHSRMLSVVADLRRDLLSRDTWRTSNYLLFPHMPDELRFSLACKQPPHFLEPNTIVVNGCLKVLARVRIDNQATAHIAAVCELSDQDDALTLAFRQFYPVPGAQNQFFILHDPPSSLLWMTANLPVCTQNDYTFPKADTFGFYGRGNDRRFLWLYYGVDGLNWFPAGCVVKGDTPSQAFNYCSMIADGEDLLIVSRTSLHMQDQHNNDHVTFHRVRDFRSLALKLFVH